MTHVNGRSPQAIFDDYATIARRRGNALETTALRTRSRSLRDLYAYLVTDGQLGFAQIARGVRSERWHARWAASLGRVVGLQNLDDGDVELAIDLLMDAKELTGRVRLRYLRLRAELLFQAGRFKELIAFLDAEPTLAEDDYRYLRTDLLNPFSRSPFADDSRWQTEFAAMFETHGISAPLLRGEAKNPFDRLVGVSNPGSVQDGPLISVIMTTFKPDAAALTTSVTSILNQTWANLELLIVDDASPLEYRSVIDQVAALDDRIRVHHMPENGGTYLARNAGIQLAHGVVITGQDDDDWSHPERLERQFAALVPGVGATQSWSIRIGNDLVFQRPGYGPARLNESSLMARRRDLIAIGGYTPARKGADTELKTRLESIIGPVEVLPDLLAVIRFEATSLSRADFGAGWRHPARHAFRDAYMYWHDQSDPDDLILDIRSREPRIPVPQRFAVSPSELDFDVVLAGDWRSYGGPQRSMIEEIRALTARGLSVGILHLEAARFMTVKDQRLCDPIRELIAQGVVRRVLLDEKHRVRILILRYPPILQFPTFEPTTLDIQRLAILANQAPSERDGTDIRYDVRTATENARRLFGRAPLWIPQGPTVRGSIVDSVESDLLARFDFPGIIDVDEWRTERAAFRSDRPVIGRHSRDNVMKWPADRQTLTSIYPTDGSVEVRIMGGSTAVAKALGTRVPPTWLSFDADEMPVRTFLNSLDFFVYYQHPEAFDAFGRSVVEALATGCVAVLPHHFEATFGDAAVYADESDALGIVHRLWADRDAYEAQSKRALRIVTEKFGRGRYADRVTELLELDPADFVTASSTSISL